MCAADPCRLRRRRGQLVHTARPRPHARALLRTAQLKPTPTTSLTAPPAPLTACVLWVSGWGWAPAALHDADHSHASFFFYYEIPLSLTRGPPCGWGLGRVRFYSGAPAGPHLPPFGREVGGSCSQGPFSRQIPGEAIKNNSSRREGGAGCDRQGDAGRERAQARAYCGRVVPSPEWVRQARKCRAETDQKRTK